MDWYFVAAEIAAGFWTSLVVWACLIDNKALRNNVVFPKIILDQSDDNSVGSTTDTSEEDAGAAPLKALVVPTTDTSEEDADAAPLKALVDPGLPTLGLTSLLTSVPVPPLTEFTLFPKLPAEIRLQIWKLSLPGPRTVALSVPWGVKCGTHVDLHATCPVPAGLHANRESRDVYLKVYKLSFASKCILPLYFNHEIDTLQISPLHLATDRSFKPHGTTYQDYVACAGPTITEINLVPRLILHYHLNNIVESQFYDVVYTIPSQFPKLDELEIMTVGTYSTRSRIWTFDKLRDLRPQNEPAYKDELIRWELIYAGLLRKKFGNTPPGKCIWRAEYDENWYENWLRTRRSMY